jgi:hypothetical protein
MGLIILVHGLLKDLFYVEMDKCSFGCINNIMINKQQVKLVNGSILFINLFDMMML